MIKEDLKTHFSTSDKNYLNGMIKKTDREEKYRQNI